MPAAAGLCCAGIYRQNEPAAGAKPVVLGVWVTAGSAGQHVRTDVWGSRHILPGSERGAGAGSRPSASVTFTASIGAGPHCAWCLHVRQSCQGTAAAQMCCLGAHGQEVVGASYTACLAPRNGCSGCGVGARWLRWQRREHSRVRPPSEACHQAVTQRVKAGYVAMDRMSRFAGAGPWFACQDHVDCLLPAIKHAFHHKLSLVGSHMQV